MASVRLTLSFPKKPVENENTQGDSFLISRRQLCFVELLESLFLCQLTYSFSFLLA